MNYLINILKIPLFRRFNINKIKIEKDDLISENLNDIKLKMDCLEKQFELETDSELIDACSYELVAMKTRYNYLLKKAKEQGIKGFMLNNSKMKGGNEIDRNE